MTLKELLHGVDVLEWAADENTQIACVRCDSRQVAAGDLFVAVSGFAVDGNRFIPMVRDRAAAVVTAQRPDTEIPYVLVRSDRRALEQISANFYGHPSESMTMVGVTGTNGKTSVTYILKQVLEKITGEKAGLIGTVENQIGNEVFPAERTTPESLQLQKLLAQMRDSGCRYVVMEVSSHAIALDRVSSLYFDVAAFTNLTEDHLDFHKTMEDYCETKEKLFGRCRCAVINRDDIWSERMIRRAAGEVFTTSACSRADLYAENIRLSADSVAFTAVHGDEKVQITVPIPGKFTVYNVLTAAGVALRLGFSLKQLAAALKEVHGVRGRVEVVPTPGEGYTVLIDYAHTPDGLRNVLSSLREFCRGRLIVVFGCGGDRDTEKRPVMGKVAAELADLAVITTDNPRTEAPMAIISDILRGVGRAKNYIVIENREKAIHYAIDIAKNDDIIVLAGKGHEVYQEIMGIRYPMDERKILAQYLSEMRKANEQNYTQTGCGMVRRPY